MSSSFETLKREESFRTPNFKESDYPALHDLIRPHLDSFNALFSCDLLNKAVSNLNNRTIRDSNGNTPLLLISSDEKYYELALALINNDANLEAKSEYGWTPLMKSSYYGSKEITKLLLSNGANIEAETDENWTALHIACSLPPLPIIRMFILVG